LSIDYTRENDVYVVFKAGAPLWEIETQDSQEHTGSPNIDKYK